MHRKVPVRFGPGAAGKGPAPQAPRRRPTGVHPDPARPSQTPPDMKPSLKCGNRTQRDAVDETMLHGMQKIRVRIPLAPHVATMAVPRLTSPTVGDWDAAREIRLRSVSTSVRCRLRLLAYWTGDHAVRWTFGDDIYACVIAWRLETACATRTDLSGVNCLLNPSK